MATPQRIATELARMAMLYRHPLDAKAELREIVAAWTELCRDLTDDDFVEACRTHLRESKFFPCPADILAAHKAKVPNRPPVLALDEHRGDPKAFAVHSAMIVASLKGNIRASEYFATADRDEKEAIAAEVLGARFVAGKVPRAGEARRFMR